MTKGVVSPYLMGEKWKLLNDGVTMILKYDLCIIQSLGTIAAVLISRYLPTLLFKDNVSSSERLLSNEKINWKGGGRKR
jgi:hypothetical protein